MTIKYVGNENFNCTSNKTEKTKQRSKNMIQLQNQLSQIITLPLAV